MERQDKHKLFDSATITCKCVSLALTTPNICAHANYVHACAMLAQLINHQGRSCCAVRPLGSFPICCRLRACKARYYGYPFAVPFARQHLCASDLLPKKRSWRLSSRLVAQKQPCCRSGRGGNGEVVEAGAGRKVRLRCKQACSPTCTAGSAVANVATSKHHNVAHMLAPSLSLCVSPETHGARCVFCLGQQGVKHECVHHCVGGCRCATSSG